MSKRKLSSKTAPSHKRRKLNNSFNTKKCASNIENALQSLFQQNVNASNHSVNSKCKPYHFCDGEIEVSSDNFLQIFIPKHTPSTIRYQGNTLLSQNCNNKTWQDLYESKNIIHQSPVGIGDKTVIDTSIRSSKELKSDEFDLSGQKFEIHDSRTNYILEQVRHCLAPYSSYINAIKYKLMIYAKNDFFKLHKDTYRGDGNIGTLLLLLPSTYKGGEFVLKHNNNIKQSNASNKKNIIKWIAFYGDVDHEILPITSGYRVSVSYNLYLAPNTKMDKWKQREWITTSFNRSLCDNICNAINHNKNGVIFVLDHEYVYTEMAPSRLKGKDRKLYTAMSGCNALKFEIKQLTTDREEYNGDDDGYYYCGDDDWELGDETQSIQNDDDKDVSDYIIIGDVYKNRQIEDESGPTGNEGQTRELSYKCTVMIVSETEGDNDQDKTKDDTNTNSNNK